MSRVDVLPALVSRFLTMQTVISGVNASAPIYRDSFDAEISMFGIYKRWILAGSALDVWQHDLRSRIQELIRENEGEIYKKYKLRGATTCHCWMLGRNQHSAKPTVVIAHNEPRILKRTMRVIDKHEILKTQGFELRGCPNCDLQLLTAASSAQIIQHVNRDSLNFPLSLCGAEVAVGVPPRYATLGGILAVGEQLYAITVAHVFTEKVPVQTRKAASHSNLVLYDMDWANSSSEDCSVDDDSSEGDRSDEGDTAEANVSRSTIFDSGRPVGVPPLDSSKAIPMGELPLFKISSESPFRNTNNKSYDGMDWALLHVPSPWCFCVNGVRRDDTWLHFEKIREDGPRGPVLIITRKGVIDGVGTGTASSIKVKGSSTYRNVWSVQSDHPLGMGDSGALVVDATTGDLYGMIVAASTAMQEGYLIPAAEITKDIQRAAGVPAVELPKRPAFTPALQYLKEFENFDRPFKAIADYISRLKVKYDRPGRMNHDLRQPSALQASHPDVRRESTHLENTIASDSQVSERVVGKENPNTLTRKNKMAVEPSRQGIYKEAEDIQRQELAYMERVLGKEHSDTLQSMNSLALVLDKQRNYKEAEEIYRHVLTTRERVLGKGHPNTISSIQNLAFALARQGHHKEADKLVGHYLSEKFRVMKMKVKQTEKEKGAPLLKRKAMLLETET